MKEVNMETRNIALTLEKAKEWYNSGNEQLKEVALQAFTEDELKEYDFRSIKTFEDAMAVIYCHNCYADIFNTIISLEKFSKASAASFKLNIIRKALNKGYEMKFDEGEIWFPSSPIVSEENCYCRREKEIEVAKVKVDNEVYTLLGGDTNNSQDDGLGCFISYGVGFGSTYSGFLGCATEEIAEHFGRYFAKEIFEAKYGDFVNFEWV